MEGEGGTFILAFLRLHTHTRKHSPSSLTCNVSLPYWTDLILSSFFFFTVVVVVVVLSMFISYFKFFLVCLFVDVCCCQTCRSGSFIVFFFLPLPMYGPLSRSFCFFPLLV